MLPKNLTLHKVPVDLCVDCEAPATHEVEGHDARCVTHYAKYFSECPTCGAAQPDAEDSWYTVHYPGSRDEPPFWEVVGCVSCRRPPHPRERGDDDGIEYGHPAEVN